MNLHRKFAHDNFSHRFLKSCPCRLVYLCRISMCLLALLIGSYAPSAIFMSTVITYFDAFNFKLGRIFTGPMYKLLLSFLLIADFYRSFVPNKTAVTKYCLTQWISKLPRSFEIHWIKQYMENFMGLAGRVNATIYKTEPIFRSRAWEIALIFNTWFTHWGWTRITAILHTIFPNGFPWISIIVFCLWFHQFVLWGLIDNKSALVQL